MTLHKNKIMGLVVLGVIVNIAIFYGGAIYGRRHPSGNANVRGQAFTQNMGGRGIRTTGSFGGLTMGEILSKDMQSMTVKLRDGGSKIIFFGDKTSVMKTVDGNLSDLIVGKQVTITGGANTDGSINATSVQIRQPTTTTQNN